eukprot:MONOS_12886.2-p1 / transcript=MONOS_12886.2 / gene=MONOS_12886 / organism=Monocercomonoides_exilis_PA203 / gene_product=unspecified product / transcript_product=unspecified product / location=Mono_scaffold00746:15272-17390(-) / protein_length=534 / sequence_SO=supercontig / SO=protein_coding / is_pseudo=false
MSWDKAIKKDIEKTLESDNILIGGAARLYQFQNSQWSFTGIYGIVCVFGKDELPFLGVINIDSATPVLTYQYECYQNMKLTPSNDQFLHYFGDNCFFGLLFVDPKECKVFAKEFSSFKPKNKGGLFSRFRSKKEDIVIGAPQDFSHGLGFSSQTRSIQGIKPELKEVAKSGGLTDDDLLTDKDLFSFLIMLSQKYGPDDEVSQEDAMRYTDLVMQCEKKKKKKEHRASKAAASASASIPSSGTPNAPPGPPSQRALPSAPAKPPRIGGAAGTGNQSVGVPRMPPPQPKSKPPFPSPSQHFTGNGAPTRPPPLNAPPAPAGGRPSPSSSAYSSPTQSPAPSSSSSPSSSAQPMQPPAGFGSLDTSASTPSSSSIPVAPPLPSATSSPASSSIPVAPPLPSPSAVPSGSVPVAPPLPSPTQTSPAPATKPDVPRFSSATLPAAGLSSTTKEPGRALPVSPDVHSSFLAGIQTFDPRKLKKIQPNERPKAADTMPANKLASSLYAVLQQRRRAIIPDDDDSCSDSDSDSDSDSSDGK